MHKYEIHWKFHFLPLRVINGEWSLYGPLIVLQHSFSLIITQLTIAETVNDEIWLFNNILQFWGLGKVTSRKCMDPSYYISITWLAPKASLGMPDLTYLNLNYKFITFTDMTLHAQNQLHNSFSFWDIKVLIASLGMSGYTSPTHVKLHHRFVALIHMCLYAKN